MTTGTSDHDDLDLESEQGVANLQREVPGRQAKGTGVVAEAIAQLQFPFHDVVVRFRDTAVAAYQLAHVGGRRDDRGEVAAADAQFDVGAPGPPHARLGPTDSISRRHSFFQVTEFAKLL